jgi:hypothetical protein
MPLCVFYTRLTLYIFLSEEQGSLFELILLWKIDQRCQHPRLHLHRRVENLRHDRQLPQENRRHRHQLESSHLRRLWERRRLHPLVPNPPANKQLPLRVVNLLPRERHLRQQNQCLQSLERPRSALAPHLGLDNRLRRLIRILRRINLKM